MQIQIQWILWSLLVVASIAGGMVINSLLRHCKYGRRTSIPLGIATGLVMFGLGFSSWVDGIVLDSKRAKLQEPVAEEGWPDDVSGILDEYEHVHRLPAATNTVDTACSEEDIDWVAYILWYEARGEASEGKRAVATVIFNRAGGDPDKMKGVCSDPTWLGHNRVVVPRKLGNCQVSRECKLLAKNLLAGNFSPVADWTHFYNPELANPGWGKRMANKKQVGNHLFGRLDG